MLRDCLIRLTVRLLLLAAILPGGSLSDCAQAFEQRTNRWKVAPTAGPQYVAVLGEVGRPGVFEFNGSVPPLSELLTLSRGTTASASGSIRIFRGGRTFQYFLSPKLKLGLLAHDLVIVDSKQMVDGQRRNVSSADVQTGVGSAGSTPTVPQPEIVQVGLVNLISRPVVLDIPASDANVAKVLALLHQPIRAKSEVTVVKPGSGIQSVAIEEAAAAELMSGTVLVFDPQTVNASVLPALPATVSSDADSLSTPGDSQLNSATSPVATPGLIPAHPHQIAASGQGVDGAAAGRTRPAAISPQPAATTAVPGISPVSSINQPQQAAQLFENFVPSPAGLELSQKPDATQPSAASTTENKSVSSRLGTGLGILAVALVFAVTALVLNRIRKSIRPEELTTLPTRSAADEAVGVLASLISDAYPIVEEPLNLPSGTEVFGRVRLEPPYRIDVAHALAGPHFTPQPVRPPASATAASADLLEPVTDQPAGRRTRIDRAHPRSGTGILDRALASFEGGQP